MPLANAITIAVQSFSSVAVRVRFPDGIVLQAGFSGAEHLSALQVGSSAAYVRLLCLQRCLKFHFCAARQGVCLATWLVPPVLRWQMAQFTVACLR